MKSTVDQLEGLYRKINVEIPAEMVQNAFNKVYKDVQKKANIKGFRQGKAPIATIKSLYGEQVKTDVLNDLINDHYSAALEQHKLEPVGYPKVSFQPISESEAFVFTAEFEIRPDIEIRKFEGLPVVKEKIEIGDEQIQQVLENIQKSQSETVTVFDDRALSDGDVAEIDFVGFVSGQPLPNGAAEGHLLEIGAKQFIEGFEDGLVGMKASDKRTLNLKFPEDYHETSLSGAPVTFEVTLKSIKKKVLPELNDELVQKLGEDFKTLADLKTRIRQDIEEGETKRVTEDLKNRLVKALVEENPVEAPETLIKKQRETLEEDFKNRLKQQGLDDADFAEYKAKWDQDFNETAAFMVKSTFLLDALADRLSIRATKAEIEDKIKEYSAQTGIEMARLNEFYNTPERRSRLAFQITEEKVVNHLLEKAKVTEVTKDKLPN